MQTISWQQDMETRYRADVAVIGGGPAGFCAAVAAARMGASVLLVEQGGCAGGMATQGLVGPFMTCYDRDGQELIIRGLFLELVERLVAVGGAIHPSEVRAGTAFTSWITVGHEHVTPFEPELLKVVMDRMLREAGVEVLYHTAFVAPVMTGENIGGLIVHSKSGLAAVSAKVVIDCTGDADVAYRAGVPCAKGNAALGITQPASMFFRMGNVDLAKVEAEIAAHRDEFYRKDGVNYRSLHWRVSEARENGDWPLNRVSIGMFRGVKEDEWFVNTSRLMGVDATDNESLTRGEIEGREQVQVIFSFFRKYVPGCEDARLLCSGSTLGIRESRHIEGLYTLTVDDLMNGRVPEDSVCVCANSEDVHGRFGPLSNE
ncbi:MAG: FAD-dependent oxidoreductase, partial [Clostridia bacterium]|nr:FAD-dependent oxidoreductase [Clostridia bacterium]